MKYVLPVLAVGALALAAPPAVSAAPLQQSGIDCPHAASPAAMKIPGFGQALEECLRIRRMNAALHQCLIAAAITTAGVVIGGWIGAAGARAIAGGIVGAGAVACVEAIRR